LSTNQQQLGNREIQNLITSHIEANKIGRHIVDTALDVKKTVCDVDSSHPHTQQDTIEEVVSIYRRLKIVVYIFVIKITMQENLVVRLKFEV